MLSVGAVFWGVGAYQAKQAKYQSGEPFAFCVKAKKIRIFELDAAQEEILKNTRNLSQSCHRARP